MCPAFGCGARRWPLAIVLSADRVPVKSPRSRRSGASGLSLSVADWHGCVTGLCSLQRRCADRSARFLSYAVIGARYGSFLAIIAHAMRAILLARATAAIFTDRRSINFTSHGWRV